VTLAFSRLRPRTRARLVKLGILHSERVYPTNRAAVEDLRASV